MSGRAGSLTLVFLLVLTGCRNTATPTDAGAIEAREAAAPVASQAPLDAGREADPDEGGEDAQARDHMHLTTDGVTKDVWIAGWASIPHPSHPEYAFKGPLGCAGQRFKTKLTKNLRLDIGYTAKRAFVVVGEDPYVLDKPPTMDGKTLVWRHA